MKQKKLVIVGDSAFAEVAYEYFTHDSPYEVVAFAVERAYLTKATLFGLPVVAIEDLVALYPPAGHDFYAALVYTQMNRLRTRLYRQVKALGYAPASYVSSRAFVWRNVELGEHCFIFEDNTVQPFVKIGDNVVLWSGNHIGHHSVVKDNCFISSHVVVSGFCTVGANCFIGVNATFGNNLEVGDDCLIGSGALIARDVPADTLVKGALGTGAPGVRERFKLGPGE
jgi:sugar O-acyltransferase (sialic acid O-acetyltransferase NeuD family)